MSAEVKGWIRVGAVITTYLVIGAAVAAMAWVVISITITVAQDLA